MRRTENGLIYLLSLTALPMTVKLLYKASQAGVEIRLIVRGACCLQPQMKDLSENIQVISIVDRYLEHARIAIFHNDGDEKVYIMSADWMTRNLDRRIEVGVPILDKEIKQTLKSFFDIQWSDNESKRSHCLWEQQLCKERRQSSLPLSDSFIRFL